jgi:Ca2+-binding RTX toxin-like protein
LLQNQNILKERGMAVYNGTANANTYGGTSSGDSISGFGGNDTLDGGAGVDTFWFASGSGSDRISDFAAGAGGDVTSLSGLGFSDFTQVQAAMSQSGADVVMRLGAGNKITFSNSLVASFDASNFTYL